MFKKKIQKGSANDVKPEIIKLVDGVKILRVSEKKIHTLFGVETDVAIANLTINGQIEDVVIISDKFYTKFDKSYCQDMIILMVKRILNKNKCSYSYDDEVMSRYDAMKDLKRTGFFGKMAFESNVRKYERRINNSVTRATRYAIKNGLSETKELNDIKLKPDEYADDEI